MRRSVLLAAAALLVVGGVAFFLLNRKSGGLEPPLRITPSPVDFGTVPFPDTKSVAVTIENVSDHEILIKDLKPGCACFSLGKPLDLTRLAPGRKAHLEILLYTPKTEPGRFAKKMTIECSDPVWPQIEIPMQGNIVDFRKVTPRELSFGPIDTSGEPVTRTIEVRGDNGSKVTVSAVESTDPRLETQLVPAKDGTDVIVRTKRGAAKGPLNAQLRLTLDVVSPEGRKAAYTEIVAVNGDFR